jgi:hypothetical protein
VGEREVRARRGELIVASDCARERGSEGKRERERDERASAAPHRLHTHARQIQDLRELAPAWLEKTAEIREYKGSDLGKMAAGGRKSWVSGASGEGVNAR